MAITPTPTVTVLPDAPQRLTETSAVFNTKADAFADGLGVMGPQVYATALAAELNATAAETAATSAEASSNAAIGASGYMGTTTATLNVTTGSQSFTIAQTGLSFAVAHQVVLILLSDDSVRLTGALTAYTAGTGATTINVTRKTGAVASGAGWAMILKALEGLSPDEVERRAISFALVL